MNRLNEKLNIELIISGHAKGADILGELWAIENNIETLIFKPDWFKYPKTAGFIRNKDIVKNADIIIAFWDEKSKGTLNSINLCKQFGKKYFIIKI